MAKKKKEFEDHPYNLDIDVINAAFAALRREQQTARRTLMSYPVGVDAFKTINYEDNRISDVKALVNGWYKDHLKKQGVEIKY